MDGVSAGDVHSVSAVAVIDLGDSGRGAGSYGAAGDPRGLLSSHSVVVIGGEEHDALLGHGHTEDDDDEDDDEDEDEDDGEGCGCGEDCGHDEQPPVHMIHVRGGGGHHSPGHSSNASTAGGGCGASKRKRVVLSIHEKQQVLQRLEMGEQPVVISRDFGISRQQVSDIKKNKDRILAFCIDAKHLSSLRRKTLKATTEYHPGVEQELYRWLIRQRKLGRSVSADALAHKTTDLFMQYAADDAAKVSFRSATVWLRHFKRAHNIKSMDEDELARLPTTFTPAMDMAGASQGAGNNDGTVSGTNASGGETSANEGSPRRSSPPPMLQEHGAMAAHDAAPLGHPPLASADDVSSYMTNLELSHQPTPSLPPPTHQQFILQNHAPTIDVNAANPYQMLMLSSTSLASATATMTAMGEPLPPQGGAPVVDDGSPLQSCVQLAQKMNSELSRFEHSMTHKLNSLDARVEKLCFSVLTTAAGSGHGHGHITATRFA